MRVAASACEYVSAKQTPCWSGPSDGTGAAERRTADDLGLAILADGHIRCARLRARE